MVNTFEFSLIFYVSLNPHKTLYVPYMWSLKYDTNEPAFETETITDLESRLVITKEGVFEGRMDGRLQM